LSAWNGHAISLRWAGAYPLVIALMVLTALALHRSFKRAGWL
jgi:Mg2+ and Co2+ transporter CorA